MSELMNEAKRRAAKKMEKAREKQKEAERSEEMQINELEKIKKEITLITESLGTQLLSTLMPVISQLRVEGFIVSHDFGKRSQFVPGRNFEYGVGDDDTTINYSSLRINISRHDIKDFFIEIIVRPYNNVPQQDSKQLKNKKNWQIIFGRYYHQASDFGSSIRKNFREEVISKIQSHLN